MKRPIQLVAAATVMLTLAACSNPAKSNSSANTTTGSSAANNKHLNIGFFGFAKANSFAQATFSGIQEYAAAHNASATFIDSNFSGPDQVTQIQDAVTSKRYDIFIVQANDGTAVVPAIRAAMAAGITVVTEFSPVGGRFDTTDSQVPGTVTVNDAPAINGAGLATLGLGACKQAAVSPCKVAYLQGFADYPLDAARTKAAVDGLTAGGAVVVANVVGGYTADSGRKAMQDVLQAHPDVNVVIGSSQAVLGASPLVAGTKILIVSNGGSSQAVDAVKAGKWYGAYVIPEKAEGAKSAELGIGKARGENVPESIDQRTLTTYQSLGTKQTLQGQVGDYTD